MVSTTPSPLYPRERLGTHCIESWLGPRTSLDGCRKSAPPSPQPGFDRRTVQSVSRHAARYIFLTFLSAGADCKGNENFIGFSLLMFHFRNHFLTFREIWSLGPNHKLSSLLILIRTGSYNPQFHIAVCISQLWICLCSEAKRGR